MVKQRPYFFDGRLHFPKHILDALIRFGLDAHTAAVVRKGIKLDDDSVLEAVRAVVQSYIASAAPQDDIARILDAPGIRFMLFDDYGVGV